MSVISLHRPDTDVKFSMEEANQVVPILLNITRKLRNEVNLHKAQLYTHKHDNEKAQDIESKIQDLVKKWGEKTTRLGATPIGLWKVLIPSHGDKPFEWEFPNSKLEH